MILVHHASLADNIHKEAQVLMKLNHPNIVKLYNTFTSGNHTVLILEYINGGDLREYVKEKISDNYGLKECEVRHIFRQLANTVSYCHDHSIIHRDLKPENVLLSCTESKSIKIIDFGIAGSHYDYDATKIGSLYILPPEALRDRIVKAYPSTDIWAMGVILYFLIYGTTPFKGDNEETLINSILTKQPELLPHKQFSEQCIDLLRKMLNKDCISRINMEGILGHPWLAIS